MPVLATLVQTPAIDWRVCLCKAKFNGIRRQQSGREDVALDLEEVKGEDR